MRAILFPGQGAQYVGMGRDFFQESAAARETFARADEVLGMKLSQLCFEGPAEALAATDVCQPAILTCSAAIVAALEERGLLRREEFGAAAGLSLGEYSALWFAGTLSLEDAVRLVRTRGQAMQQASQLVPSGMVSLVGADGTKAEEVCRRHAGDQVLTCANFLSPRSVTLSGSQVAIERVVNHAAEDGVRKAVRLKVAGAFHSSLMEPALPELEQALAGVELKEPYLPVISNVTALPLENAEAVRAALTRQITSPVQWERSMRYLCEQGLEGVLEPGPGAVLSGLMRQIDRTTRRQSVDQLDDMRAMMAEGAEAKGMVAKGGSSS